MRGYNEGRFVDDVYFAIQLEYRFPLIWRFGGVLFLGVGRVTPKLREFSFFNTKYAGGLGLRFTFLESPQANLRLDFRLSPDGLEIYANVQEAFLAIRTVRSLMRRSPKMSSGLLKAEQANVLNSIS